MGDQQKNAAVAYKHGSNWESLKKNINKRKSPGQKRQFSQSVPKIVSSAQEQSRKRPRPLQSSAGHLAQISNEAEEATPKWAINPSLLVALDCEMVGVGRNGRRSVLARCTLVNHKEEVIYDKFVKPLERITDFRTRYSGIRSYNLKKAISFKQCQEEVAEMIKGKILIGHALKNDLDVLMLQHPPSDRRDTAHFPPLMRASVKKLRPQKLRTLASDELGMEIQSGEHDSAIDATVCLKLYKKYMKEWEKHGKAKKNPLIRRAKVGTRCRVQILQRAESSSITPQVKHEAPFSLKVAKDEDEYAAG